VPGTFNEVNGPIDYLLEVESTGIGCTKEELRRLQQCDPKIGPVVTWVETGAHPQHDELDSYDAEIKSYWTQWDSLTLQEGLLCLRFERLDGICHHVQLLMPRSLRPSFLKMVHGQSTGHFGYEKTLEQVQRRAYWDSWKTDVKLFCVCCKPCNEFHRGRLPKQAYIRYGQRHAEVNKRAYDVKVYPGDLVWFFCPKSRPGTSPKWTRFYSGPYRVVRKINDVNYVIQLAPRSRLRVVHVNKVKKHEKFYLA